MLGVKYNLIIRAQILQPWCEHTIFSGRPYKYYMYTFYITISDFY